MAKAAVPAVYRTNGHENATLLRSRSAKQAAIPRQQPDQFFDEAANGMVPEHVKKKPEDALKKWRPQSNRKLNEGYRVRQIQAIVRSPKVGLNVSMRSRHRLITAHKGAQGKVATSV